MRSELARAVEEVVCHDGWRLSVVVVTPPAPRAVCIVGHAMMVDRRTIELGGRGLAPHLARRGIACVVPDLRGHGASVPSARAGGDWSYDDLVDGDAPALRAFARARFPGLPLASVGHSLFGHVQLADAARRPDEAPARIVALAANVWMPRCEPSPTLRLVKRALLEASVPAVRLVGYLPARRLGIGPADEAPTYWRSVLECMRDDRWRARDGFDWFAALAGIRSPLLALVGAGDELLCRPECQRRFVAAVPVHTVEVVGRRTGLPVDPGHMHLVTDPRCAPAWERVADFILDGT